MTRLTRVAVTRWEFEEQLCGLAVPVYGPHGKVIAAIEVAVPDLRQDATPILTALALASRSLSRELAGAT